MTQEQITDTNCIICGDCRDQLARIPDGSVNLIYLDPPFFSGRKYEVIWGDGSEIRSFTDKEFFTLVCKCGKIFPVNDRFCAHCGVSRDKATEKQSTDIEAYLQWMRSRLDQCKRVLKDTGSIYCHLDWHAVHYVKVMMDEIFGRDNLKNDITWSYQSSGGLPKRYFPRKHDNILFYSKTKNNNFTPQYIPYRQEYIDTFFTQNDNDGKGKYQTQSDGKGGRRKQYLNKQKGQMLNDTWTDIQPAHSFGCKDKYLWPTQKPEALLERIIKASSNPGDVILDPFCGCGTAITVAHKLGRRWIGIDVSHTSCGVMVERLRRLNVNIRESDVINMDYTIDVLRDMPWEEFQNWVMKQLYAKVNPKSRGDGGIDGWTYKKTDDNAELKIIGSMDACIQVKRSDAIGFPEIQKFMGAMDTNNSLNKDNKTNGKHGIFVAFSFAKNANKKLMNQRSDSGKLVELITVEELLSGHRMIQHTI